MYIGIFTYIHIYTDILKKKKRKGLWRERESTYFPFRAMVWVGRERQMERQACLYPVLMLTAWKSHPEGEWSMQMLEPAPL